MIDLRKILTEVLAHEPRLDAGRINNLLGALEAMLGSTSLEITEDRLPGIREEFRSHLKEIGAAAATIRNQVYRLNMALVAAENHRLFGTAVYQFETGFPVMEVPRGDKIRLRLHKALLSFEDWCREEQIHFSTITPSTFHRYREHLKQKPSSAKSNRPEVLYTDLVRAWKDGATAGDLPPHDLPRWKDESKKDYGLHRKNWPARIARDFTAFEDSAKPDTAPTKKRAPMLLRKTSIKTYASDLGKLIGYAIHIAGRDLGKSRLVDVLGDEKLLLEFIAWHQRERCGGKRRIYHDEWLATFERLRRNLSGDWNTPEPRAHSPRPKKAKRVHDRFPEDRVEYDHYIEAANRAIDDARHAWNTANAGGGEREILLAACGMRDAFCFALLIRRPMRSRNLRQMLPERNLYRDPEGNWQIRFQPNEMKTGAFQCQFPPPLVGLLEFYLKDVRGVLCGSNKSARLLPSKSGRLLRDTDLWRRMTEMGKKYLGLKLTPHQFRHLVATAYLNEHPTELDNVRALLGHNDARITLSRYVHIYSFDASVRLAEEQRKHCPSLIRLGELLREYDTPPGDAPDAKVPAEGEGTAEAHP